MKEWITFLVTEAPDGPVIMVAPTTRAVGPDIVWPLQELLGPAFGFYKANLTAVIGTRHVVILLASDPRHAIKRMRGQRFAGAWNARMLTGEAADVLTSRLVPGARCF